MSPGDFYGKLTEQSLAGAQLADEVSRRILTDPAVELLPLLDTAFAVRREYWGREVTVHIINNAQNGRCPEDCSYCAQASNSQAVIAEYSLKSDAEILAEAKNAYEAGAFRYCVVLSGRGPGPGWTERMAGLVREIKAAYPLEVCVSPGLMEREGLQQLKDAGLDRLNHNLNTSASNYPRICTTHTYQDRLNTLRLAKEVGLEVCSGVIAGMGETAAELVELAKILRRLEVKSIPVNFLVPLAGNALAEPQGLTPAYCLRVLCLFRLLNPAAEIRAAAGREGHLRSLEALALYPANSIFRDGYLHTRGGGTAADTANDSRRRLHPQVRVPVGGAAGAGRCGFVSA